MKKRQTRVQDLPVGKLINYCFVVALLCCLGTAANAQISVGSSGSGILTFTTAPTPDQWATFDITPGDAGTWTTPEAVDAGAQTLAASSITTALAATAGTGTARLARHDATAGTLVTRPTGVPATVLMATLRNTSGSAINTITVSYSYGVPLASTANPDDAHGHRAFFSTTGQTDSWTLIPEFSGLTAAASVSATLAVGNWAPNTDIYLLWLDDNSLANNDGAYSIDNFEVVNAVATPITITNQPQSQTVTVAQPVTFSVGASGSPRTFFWRKDGAVISGATGPSYTIPSVASTDAGVYSVIVSNSLGAVTSANATLTVRADTNGPVLLSALGNAAGDQVTLTFNEPLDVGTGAENSNYEIFLTAGGGDLLVSLASITNGSNVVITTDPSTPRNPGENYSVRISNVADRFGNVIVPNPTTRAIAPEVVLLASDGTHIWRYDESGTDQAGFQAINFNDASWPTAPSTFTQTGGETITLPDFIDGTGGASSQILTPRSAGGPVTTYFRTRFTLPTAPSNAVVNLGYIVDDGAIVYINGNEVHRVRMPAGTVAFNQDASTTSPEPPALVGPILIASSNLVAGENVIAIEVHQSGATSSDVVMGLRLTAFVSAFASGPPSITSQPQSLTVTAGQSAGFSVGVTGGLPFTYQWRRNGVAIPGATSSSYSIPITTTADAGTYTVAITNSAGGVISAGATLTVNPDTSVLTVVSVSGNLNFTNFTVTFSERVGASASNAANYRVALTNGSGALTVISAVVNNNTNVILTTSTPRSSGQAYSITISNVTDLTGNALVPNPTVVSIPVDTILIPFDGTWRYFLGSTNAGGDLTGTGWQAPGYNDSAWLSGPGGLGHESDSGSTNPPVGLPGNNAVPIRTHVDYMSNSVPIYFRANFTLSSTTGITLNLRDVVEDGAIYYLNGQEAFRNNVNATSAVNFATRAAAGATDPTPVTGPFSLPTTNLVVGDNVIAVQLVQSGNTSSDAEFAAQLSIRGGAPTTPPGPRINIAYNDAANTVTLTWNAPGYRLQEASAIGSPTAWVNSTRTSGTPFTPTGNMFYRLISP